MTATIEFFPVGSGDMTLITLDSGKRILIDVNIRQKADKESETDYPDVAAMLKERLDRDKKSRLFVDVFILTHPDRDHCAGLTTHFHLSDPDKWKKPTENEPETVIIREMWSSPLTFRRTDKIDGALTENAEEWRKEAKRRVKLFKDKSSYTSIDGNKILVLGEDIHNKNADIDAIVVKVGESISHICGQIDDTFSALLLSPKIVSDEEANELPGKNNSSIVMQFTLASDSNDEAAKFLTGGDAEVDIWERIWERNKKGTSNLEYNILQTPHHSSLGALSRDEYKDKGEKCEISIKSHSALSQTLDGAFIIASADKPEDKSGREFAQRKYTAIAENCKGTFLCTMVDSKDKPLLITITDNGPNDMGEKKKPDPAPPKVKKGTTEGSYA